VSGAKTLTQAWDSARVHSLDSLLDLRLTHSGMSAVSTGSVIVSKLFKNKASVAGRPQIKRVTEKRQSFLVASDWNL